MTRNDQGGRARDARGPADGSSRRPSRFLSKSLVFGFLPLALLLVLTEALLTLLGVADRVVPFRTRLTDEGRVAVTLWGHDDRKRELELDPRPTGGVRRVVMVGASTVQGYQLRPTSTIPRFLEPFLTDLYGSPHEVVNLGVPGISARGVRRAAEMALERLSPDVVVVYTGHNEFIRGNPTRVIEERERPLRSWARGVVAATRTGRALASAAGLSAPRALVAGIRPSGFVVLEESVIAPYRDLVLDDYELQLRALVRACDARGVPAVLTLPVSNGREYGPLASAHSKQLSAEERARYLALLEEAAAHYEQGKLDACEAVLERAEAIDPEVAEAYHLRGRIAWDRGDAEEARHFDHLKWGADDMCQVASAALLERVRRVAAETGALCVDPIPAVERIPDGKEPPFFLDPVHPAVYGQYLIAREIATACAASDALGTEASRDRAGSLPQELSYMRLCQRLEIRRAFRDRAVDFSALGLVNHACFALHAEPYLDRAEEVLAEAEESRPLRGSMLEARVLLAILQSDSEWLHAHSPLEALLSPDSYERLLRNVTHQPNVSRALERAGFELSGGAIVASGAGRSARTE